MFMPIEKARAYLDTLEADRRAALALSELKAEEARLIKARQEGFQAAMAMAGMAIPAGNDAADPKEPGRRSARRHIRELILRELSFSGRAMTAAQIAKAIDYHPERTGTALERLEKDGQVLRNAEGRWVVGNTTPGPLNGHALNGAMKHSKRQLSFSKHRSGPLRKTAPSPAAGNGELTLC